MKHQLAELFEIIPMLDMKESFFIIKNSGTYFDADELAKEERELDFEMQKYNN